MTRLLVPDGMVGIFQDLLGFSRITEKENIQWAANVTRWGQTSEENSFKRSATQITTVWRGVVCGAAAGEMDAPAAASAVTPVLLSLVVVGGDVYGWQLWQQPCEYCKNKVSCKDAPGSAVGLLHTGYNRSAEEHLWANSWSNLKPHECPFSQLRRESLHRLTETGQLKTGNMFPGLMSLDFCNIKTSASCRLFILLVLKEYFLHTAWAS